MADDPEEPTPRERPAKRASTAAQWGDDERAAVGREHRGAESARGKPAPTDSQLRRARRDAHHPLEVPVMMPIGADDAENDEPTSPVALLNRVRDPEVDDVVRRSRRDSGAPATVEDIVALKLSWDRQVRRDRSSSEEARKVIAMLPSPDELKEMRAEVTRFKTASIVLKAAAVIALGAAGYVVDKVVTRLGTDGANEIRIEHLERNVDRVLDKLDRIDRQPRQAAQKDSTQ